MFGEIITLVSAARMAIFIIILVVVGGWGYFQHVGKNSAIAQLEGVRGQLEACEAINRTSNAARETKQDYRRNQDDVVDNYYKTMPKRPEITVDDDNPGAVESPPSTSTVPRSPNPTGPSLPSAPNVRLRTPASGGKTDSKHLPSGENPGDQTSRRIDTTKAAETQTRGADNPGWKTIWGLFSR